MNGPGETDLETGLGMARALAAGKATATELVERALERAEAWQPAIVALSQSWADEALAEARRVDALPRDGGPSSGIPIVVKDLFDVAGHETTGCSLAYRGRVAAVDAPTVAALRAAGLILIGKANQHELAAGGTGLASACGRSGNPWNPHRITGGSSGGSAAAVAAGIVPWALGSDTGGSIRIPGSMCGVYGLKPTTGALPTEGMLPLAPSMDCPGPIAATAGDLAALWRWWGMPLGAGRSGGEGRDEDPTGRGRGGAIRIGVPDGFFASHVHADALAAVEGAGRTLEDSGIVMEAVDGHGIDDARRVWMQVCGPEFAAVHPALRDPDRRALLSTQVRGWLEAGEGLAPEARAAADRRREEIRRWFRERLSGRDALLVPTTPYPAFPAGETRVELGGGAGAVDVDEVGPGWLSCSVNLAGLPALQFPAGRARDGMPVGATLIGAAGSERDLLRLAATWEHASGYRPTRPALT